MAREPRMTPMERQRKERRAMIARLEAIPKRTASENTALARLKTFEARDPEVIREREIRGMFRSN